jgi:DNA-binding MarR family transcriptional regulator
MNTSENQELIRMVEGMIDRILYLEKGNSLEVEGRTLYPTEIHLLLVIDKGRHGNATRMAERMGVTKGAVSQTLSRLESKGMLIKSRDPASKNELNLALTPAGQRAARRAREVTGHVQQRYGEFLAGLDVTEKEVIRRFLTTMNNIFENLG